MAKKQSWFNLLRRFFLGDANSKAEKKEKRRRWAFGRFRNKRLASISAPSPLNKTTQDETVERSQKSAINIAISTKTAFETSKSATESVRLISVCSPQSPLECTTESQEHSAINFYVPVPQSYHQCKIDEIQNLAATRIQSAFRGYLARKALRALKGLVRLQAIIRGWAVRRQAMNTLKCLQTIVNIQTEVCAKRCDMVKGTPQYQEDKMQDSSEKDIKIDLNSKKRWDDSLLSREEANALSMSKRVTAIKRERIKEYWLNHRRSAESEHSRLSIRQRYWLEQWVDAQLAKRGDLENLDAVFSSTAKNKEEISSRRLKLRNLQKQYQIEALDSLVYVPRRSFHERKRSVEDGPLVGSPAVPTYMAATESARAKARSLSSPRLRPINMDAYSEINSPYKHKLSPISSINSEMTCSSQISKPFGFSQRSPCLKGLPGPVKSTRSLKELKFTSESSLPH